MSLQAKACLRFRHHRRARDARARCIDVNARGEVFIADTGNHVIRKLMTDGRLITIAGQPGVAGYADGDASTALFAGPVGIRLDGENLFVADTSNNAVRQLTLVSTERRRPIRH